MIRKLKQLWCWLRHDHKGVTILSQSKLRCKSCGKVIDVW